LSAGFLEVPRNRNVGVILGKKQPKIAEKGGIRRGAAAQATTHRSLRSSCAAIFSLLASAGGCCMMNSQ
jgi:hypothetical protein